MKKLLLSISILCFLSCAEKKQQALNAVENAESKTSYTRFSKGQNMLDAVYNEQIKNDPPLKKLDEKINTLYDDSQKVKSINQELTGKSSEYYSDVETAAKSIDDTVLKKHILAIIKISSEKNYLKEKKLRDFILQINRNNQTIYSQYKAFKIRKTLPEIEKYQNAHSLKTDTLEKFINTQNDLLKQLKNLK